MDQGNEAYAEEYKALQEILTHYPAIHITSTEKDPPETYVIEYKVDGYGYGPDGSVQVANRHKVEINLPFGYPHFPPIVKPITRICHPDVDENAVRIATYWQETPSLPDLVVYIGHMIRGAEYSEEGAFNQNAAEWYSKHADNLPLGNIDYVKDPNAVARVSEPGEGLNLKLVAGICIVVAMVVGGGLVLRDYQLTKKAADKLTEAESLVENLKFEQAKEIGETAIDSLGGVLIMRSTRDERLTQLQDFLDSPRVQQGLQGKVDYEGVFVTIAEADALQQIGKLNTLATEFVEKGNLPDAIRYFGDAERLAEEYGLKEALAGVKRSSAKARNDFYLEMANNSYEFEEWEKAGELYGKVVSILKNEADSLPENDATALEKIEILRVLSLANFHESEATRLERDKEYARAAEHYRAIASIVQRSEYPEDSVLMSLKNDALKEVDRVEDQEIIAAGQEYLLKNFKELFKKHYPGVHGPALQSPRAKFMGRSGNNFVFVMSCIELIQRSSNEFRLYYQYDPATRKWSIYRERK